MKTNMLASARSLSNQDLLDRLAVLAGNERHASVELVAHLAELDTRDLHLGEGVRSLYRYCTEILHMSEHAAFNRIAAARAARRFPVILDLLADGSVNLTTVTLLAPHLTPENHHAVLEEATRRTKEEIEVIKARLAPRPDVPATIRKLPAPVSVGGTLSLAAATRENEGTPPPPVLQSPIPQPVLEPLTPERYRLQFTVGKATHDTLRRLQNLLAREIPDGDPVVIVDRALTLLLKDVEKRKLGAVAKPRAPRPTNPRSRHPGPHPSSSEPPRRRPLRVPGQGRKAVHGKEVPSGTT